MGRPGAKALTAALTVVVFAVTAATQCAVGGAKPPRHIVSVTVGSQPVGRPLPPGFVGPSMEYPALHQYTGSDPAAINQAIVALIRNLAPGQRPVLRIGGHSADYTWWPEAGPVPAGASYALTGNWLATAHALAAALDAKMIMDLNLAAGSPQVAAAEAQALVHGIGAQYIEALEIGNEPDLYSTSSPFSPAGINPLVHARPAGYNLSDYIAEFTRWRAALAGMPPAIGPALSGDWFSELGSFIAADPGVPMITAHRYPLRACETDPNDAEYPTIEHLLSDQSSSGMAQELARYVAVAHAHGVLFRLDELNSVSCGGQPGVSNTFASALWMLDTLFNLANVGVDGVNVHTYPGGAYASFSVGPSGTETTVYPEYYGMLMFARAFPTGAQLLPVKVSRAGPLKAWVTGGRGYATRVTLINKNPWRTYTVLLRGHGLSGLARLNRLRAPSLRSTYHVTLGGMTFGNETATGLLRGKRRIATARPSDGVYSITVPAGSAVLVTL